MALSIEYIQEITSILERISANLPGYLPRMSQKRMIAAVAEVLSRAENAPDEDTPPARNTGKSILAVQGPTGVGKSLAYLVGVVVAARAMKRSIVISSATVALQEQLENRDVPFFVKNSGMPLTFTIAKGRTRYVCHHKLTGASGDGDPHGDGDLFMESVLLERKPLESEIKIYSQLLNNFNNGKWTGDRDELPGDYCAHVVITKIPFAVPSDPVQKTLDDWLSGQGRSYFNEIAVPQACLRMIQAAGRLIRSESDTGQITILDERLTKTNYGRLIKNSLPPFRMLNA